MITKEKILEILHSHSYNVEDQAGNHLIVVDDDSWDEIAKQIKNYSIPDISKSLPIQNLQNCTRVEVIDQKGRSYVNWKPTNKVKLSMQDDGKTAKIFID